MCLYSCAKYGGGHHVRDPSMLQPPLLVFIFQEAVRRSIRSPWQLIVTWAAEGNNCSSYLMCFSASSAFVPFDESKEGKNRGRVVGKCVCVCGCMALFMRIQAICGGTGSKITNPAMFSALQSHVCKDIDSRTKMWFWELANTLCKHIFWQNFLSFSLLCKEKHTLRPSSVWIYVNH